MVATPKAPRGWTAGRHAVPAIGISVIPSSVESAWSLAFSVQNKADVNGLLTFAAAGGFELA